MKTTTKIPQNQKEQLIPYTTEELFRLKKLEDKKETNKFELAFCGHFSAGKSTILNTILGAKVLPTSPIPTSANIITICNGELQLALQTRDEQVKIWNGEIPWSKVREWGMNGNEILGLTISAPLSFLGNTSLILDTPGVDSTDQSHEAMTVEQLYTTDVIVYVMDYNHVQSETNLYFLKQLSIESKPVFIVINQVDKHDDKEIPFTDFKQSIQDVFRQWGIEYLSIYFTSMKQTSHQLNEFPRFEKAIKSLLFNSKELLFTSQQSLEYGFYRAVENRLKEEQKQKKEEKLQEIKDKGYDIDVVKHRHSLTNELHKLNRYEDVIYKEFEQTLGRLFLNVTLFPYTTTDLARSWIESLQPGFRVGLLFSKKKTQEEQVKRLKALVNDLQDKVKKQLLFHIQTFFQNVDRLTLTNESEYEEGLSRLSFSITGEWLKKYVKVEHTNRDYVFVYTREVTTLITKEVRNKAKELLEIQIAGTKNHIVEQKNLIEEKLLEFSDLQNYIKEIEETESNYRHLLESVTDTISHLPSNTSYREQLKNYTKKSFPISLENSFKNVEIPDQSIIHSEWKEEELKEVEFSENESLKWLLNIKETLLKYNATTILSKDRKDLIERINRYEKQTFIISLFGAFSAGKSSFANALLGENILPVSPNPTTATINTVEKGTRENPHGTATVTLKSWDVLNEEIKTVSSQLDVSLDLVGLQHWKPNVKDYISNWQKTYVEYLLTIKRSMDSTDWTLGKKYTIQHNELSHIIAEESNACLVEEVNIYYNSPVTEKGIKLVDTPGVNSIHGRHTNVAFKQMRQSDAIFYLTYYNHSFSKSDQYFLQQIGRVNESFNQDKLYFIINAADLAGSTGELHGVKKHVYDQLLANGIDNPRLYPLSSREGLSSKQERRQEETLYSQFEKTFYNQTIIELKQLSVKIISQQLQQYHEKLNDSVLFMNSEIVDQKQKHKVLKVTLGRLHKQVNEASFRYVYRDVHNEFDELLLYLRERMRFVLNDYFTTAINVTVLISDNKKGLQTQFINATGEWRRLGEHFMKQEMEATLIRIEEKIKGRAKQWLSEEMKKLHIELPYLSYEDEVEIEAIEGNMEDLILTIDPNVYLPFIKSKKDFFENGKMKQVKEELIKQGVENASHIIISKSKYLQQFIDKAISQLEDNLKERLKISLNNELERFEALFNPQEKILLVNEYETLRSKL